MANQDIVSKNKLTALADKIRDNTEISRSLTIDEINDGVTNIANKFSDLIKRSSTEIFVPASVETIGEYAFAGCTNLVAIDFSSYTSIPTLVNVNAFSNIASGCKAFIPNDLYDEWIASDIWADVTTLTFVKAFSEGLKYTLTDNTYSVSGIGTCTDIEIRIPLTYDGLSVTSIGNYAFSGCSRLTNITIPDSVTSIGDYAFNRCNSLTNITIPGSVTSIKGSAFNECSSLTSITIPNSVTSIGYGAFIRCTSLASIIVSSDNSIYDSRNNCNAIIKTETNTLAFGCKNTIIPDSVTSIGASAFNGSSITSITIPDSVTRIESEVFSKCTSLASIIVSSDNSIYDSRNNCNAIIKTETNTLAFGCKNTIIPDSVTSIGASAFRGCNLTNITIPDSVTSIGGHAFDECTSLASITIPNGVTSIGDWTFSNCSSLASITIGNCVTTIGDYAFYNCKSLTSIKIPDSVASIGNCAFYFCSSLAMIDFSICTTIPTLSNVNAFNNVASGCQAILPDALYDQWITATNWVNVTTLTYKKASEVA